MYHYRGQELPQADTLGYPTSTRHVIVHPQNQYLVSPSRPYWRASPPMRNESAIQTFEATHPVFSGDVNLVTDVNTILNCDIRPPPWATVDNHNHERRGVRPARRLAIPSSDAVWGRRRTLSRSTGSITSVGALESSRGSNYYSRYWYQTPHHAISESEDDSEDETREPVNTVAPSLSGATEVHPYHQERYSRPWSNRRGPATAAVSGPSPRPLKGIKRVLHKILSKFRRKRPSGRLPPTTAYIPAALVPAATASAVTIILAPCNAYDSVQYCVHDEFNTGASTLERTHTIQMQIAQRQPHPLTTETDQTVARVRRAVQTGSNEYLGLIMMGTSTWASL